MKGTVVRRWRVLDKPESGCKHKDEQEDHHHIGTDRESEGKNLRRDQ
jgi:hypothetical protein